MRQRNLLCVSAGLVVLCASQADAGLQPLTQSVRIDRALETATFTLSFDHTPDLYTLDAAGRPADSFQYEIAEAMTPDVGTLLHPSVILRGDEIHVGGKVIVREASPADESDPNSGGWGKIVAALPFTTNGSPLTFAAPLSAIGAPDGVFVYRVFTMSHGQIDAVAEGSSVPLPAAVPAIGAMIASGLLVRRRGRRW